MPTDRYGSATPVRRERNRSFVNRQRSESSLCANFRVSGTSEPRRGLAAQSASGATNSHPNSNVISSFPTASFLETSEIPMSPCLL